MARYDREHKEATRRRIIATAGRRLKSDGIDGSGVATLMADAGLTNGAFYSHFASKEDLVAQTLTDQMAAQRDALCALVGEPQALQAFLETYLSTAHRDAPAQGCPSGALLDEIARSSEPIKAAYTAGVIQVADAFAQAATSPPISPGPAPGPTASGESGTGEQPLGQVAALTVLASLAGVLQLSRALSDRALAQAVLKQALAMTPALLQTVRAHR